MANLDILIPAAVMTLLRREETVRGIADRFGVTEAQVREWKDVFVIAGALALAEIRRRGQYIDSTQQGPGVCGSNPMTGDPTTPDACVGDPTTPDFGEPTTPDFDFGEPTTPDFGDSATTT